ncbi:hypothetical protein O6H91_21G019900 [Diphasiastrum complanatum]|uniref:Uncharacterized protein n=1 Tax=Diphasiastrum complanatum TaxID=34168 RepID=A0ACC2AID5_DIPCM|nr:hypothetical protein O6H91_21G019900 [Diphasiastrum complanatum]
MHVLIAPNVMVEGDHCVKNHCHNAQTKEGQWAHYHLHCKVEAFLAKGKNGYSLALVERISKATKTNISLIINILPFKSDLILHLPITLLTYTSLNVRRRLMWSLTRH